MDIKKDKKLIRNIIICSALVLILLCTFIVRYFSRKIDSKIYLFNMDSNEIYTLNHDGEKVSLIDEHTENNIINIVYSKNLRRYIAVDDNNKMYSLDKSSNIKKLADDVLFDTIKTPYSDKVFFIGTDNKLYYKSEVGVKQQVKTNIQDYKVLNNNEKLYLDLDNNLFYELTGYNAKQIASDVTKYKVSPDNKVIAYLSSHKLFIYNLCDDEVYEVSDNIFDGDFEFADNQSIVYFDNYDNNTGRGDIYYKRGSIDKVKLASDASAFVVDNDKGREGIYYISGDKILNYKTFNGDTNSNLMNDTQQIIKSSRGKEIFAYDSDNNIYRLKSHKNVEKIFEHAVSFKPGKSDMIILDNDNNLFMGQVKIAENVQEFNVNENEVIYINKDNDIYIVKGKNSNKKLIGNTSDFSRVVFENRLLYQANMQNKDITGYWRAFDNYTKYEAHYKFGEDCSVSIMDYNNQERTYKYLITNMEPGKMTIEFNNSIVEITTNEDRSINLRYPDGSKVELKKVTEDDYYDAQAIIDKIYPKAEELYGQGNAKFKCVKTIKDFDYYLYDRKYDDSNVEFKNQIYIDQYGSPFIFDGEEDSMKPLLEKDKY